jgi:hypothetical protein
VNAFLDERVSCGPEHEKHGCKPEDVAKFRQSTAIECVALRAGVASTETVLTAVSTTTLVVSFNAAFVALFNLFVHLDVLSLVSHLSHCFCSRSSL